MAKANVPVFSIVQIIAMVSFSTANTGRDGTSGTFATLYTAPSEGARISYIRVKATGTTTAGMVRIFIAPTSGGTKQLIAEIAIAAATPSASVQSAEGEFYFTEPLLLPPSYTLFLTTHNNEAFHGFAMGSAYN